LSDVFVGRYHPASRENQTMNRRAFVTGLGAGLAAPLAPRRNRGDRFDRCYGSFF